MVFHNSFIIIIIINLIYSFIHNMYSITIQFESWVQIDTWRQVQQDKKSLVTALY